jgi:16S rRNA (guanine966-N2)-methyltransferase
MFSMLGSYYGCPGALPPISVADVFAGSGSLGLEALSRGAVSCCFFERNREALKTLRRNIASLDAESVATVNTSNAWMHAVSDDSGRPFGLVFLDPPYRDSKDTSETGAVCRYLRRLGLPEGTTPLVVLHHEVSERFGSPLGDGWRLIKHRTFGTNALSFLLK